MFMNTITTTTTTATDDNAATSIAVLSEMLCIQCLVKYVC